MPQIMIKTKTKKKRFKLNYFFFCSFNGTTFMLKIIKKENNQSSTINQSII